MPTTGKAGTARRGKGRPRRGQPGVGRDAVIRAAREFLKRPPPRDPTRAEFSRHASIDPSLVRYYFGNIASLLTEGLREIFCELQSRRATVAPDASFRLQLRQRIGSLIEVLEANPQLHQLVMRPLLHVEMERAEEVEALRRDYTLASLDSLRSLVARAEANGESIPTDVPMLFIVLTGLSDFAVRCYQYFDILSIKAETRAEVLSRYADFVTDLLVDGLQPR